MSTPTRTSASTWCITMGLFTNSTSGFGFVKVRGRSLVPNPPTRINAFPGMIAEGRFARPKVPLWLLRQLYQSGKNRARVSRPHEKTEAVWCFCSQVVGDCREKPRGSCRRAHSGAQSAGRGNGFNDASASRTTPLRRRGGPAAHGSKPLGGRQIRRLGRRLRVLAVALPRLAAPHGVDPLHMGAALSRAQGEGVVCSEPRSGFSTLPKVLQNR